MTFACEADDWKVMVILIIITGLASSRNSKTVADNVNIFFRFNNSIKKP